MARKATYSRRLGVGVKRAGGASAYRSRMGYLPAGYHADPKKFAGSLNRKQEARISKMHAGMSAVGFKRAYGFTRMAKKVRDRY